MTRIIAHRGASAIERENTLAAFTTAARLGADGVELDVRRTADGVLIVHHDAHVGDGEPICRRHMADMPGYVPTLDAALDACAGMFVNVEIKNDPEEPDFDPSDWVAHRVASVLARRRPWGRWLISSFRLETVTTVGLTMPAARRAWLVEHLDDDMLAVAAESGHDAIHPRLDSVDERLVVAAHTLGLAINVWTCDDPDQIRQLVAWGVDGICTNVPDVALSVRRGVLGSTD